MKYSRFLAVLAFALDAAIVYALPATAKWDLEELYRTPQSWPCEAFAAKSNQLSIVTESGTVTARYVWLEGLATVLPIASSFLLTLS